ncbi:MULTISPECIES: hypothetical protein [Methanocalculus]|uniref:hypothetical protein n=2 Tax=Methanocalculaceae TaxID=1460864 RepID=UPI00209F182E|nr:hypothetical protein [Methanocalculus sp. AMF5]MCP1662870.1 DNA-directed RNA polymerase subunit RPC12/RpoP [Methanocalculus sp. AMF5]
MSAFQCPKCGAPMKVDSGIHFSKCAYCESTVFVDRAGVMFFYALPFTINEDKAKAIFRRWTAGPLMAKELEKGAEITSFTKIYFPVYQFKRDENGREKILVRPAKGTTLPGMQELKIPPGDITLYDSSFDAGDALVEEVEINMDAYLEEMPGTPKEQSLIYFPIYSVTYSFNGEEFNAIIDGSGGTVYAGTFPTRSSFPYMLVAGAGFGIAFIGALLGGIVDAIFFILVVIGLGVSLYLGHRVTREV